MRGSIIGLAVALDMVTASRPTRAWWSDHRLPVTHH